MMIGLFVVGGAIFQTGLAKMISSRILKLAGTSEIRLFLLVMLVTSAIGAFVSNTGTVALMLPIVVSLAMSAGMNPSRLLMPLAFASSMGGMMMFSRWLKKQSIFMERTFIQNLRFRDVHAEFTGHQRTIFFFDAYHQTFVLIPDTTFFDIFTQEK